jgi:hypothetical protein
VAVKFPATKRQLIAAGYKCHYERPCRLCQTHLEFWTAPGGKCVALETVIVDGEWLQVNHFETCKFAHEFRKEKREPAKPQKQKGLFD